MAAIRISRLWVKESSRILCVKQTISSKKSISLTQKAYFSTIDQEELQNFEKHANEMWNEGGAYETLHLMNRLRVPFVIDGILGSQPLLTAQPLEGKRILDVGCGGGLLSEALARLGARVTGIDVSSTSIDVARHHASIDPQLLHPPRYLNQDVNHLQTPPESTHDSEEMLKEGNTSRFDAVVASEVIEHVTDVALFLDGCCRLVKPGGSIFLTTMNKTNLSYFLTIIMAEDVLRIVPRGMHDWQKYVSPQLLRQLLTERGFATMNVRGMFYNPLTKTWSWQDDTSVNYALHAVNMSMDFQETAHT